MGKNVNHLFTQRQGTWQPDEERPCFLYGLLPSPGQHYVPSPSQTYRHESQGYCAFRRVRKSERNRVKQKLRKEGKVKWREC